MVNSLIQKLTEYCENHTTSQTELLYDLERETNLKTLAPQMTSGHLQGQFLSLLSHLIQPKAILEIGTFTGYATICLAQGLQKNGIIHTIEVNEELEYLSKKYFEKSGLQHKIKTHIGNAKTIIPTLKEEFDIVFIDAGKLDYPEFYDLIFDRVKKGGLILSDNVLWSGKIVNGATDKHTRQLDFYNKKLLKDDRIEQLILPLRDGMGIARKL
ncbi:O-methyltransferase [Saprospiraceae bacterium]|jgi:predicted O-methyltransferase YrrM|nr:O-methyltransferase [Bacteroidota bacterium]MDB4728117.1 O-methyltransferase [Saprospiraceae bacterium]